MSRHSHPEVRRQRGSSTPECRRGSEVGDTLLEILIAIVVLGLASVALLVAFGTSISSSADHRNLATFDTILATTSQEAISAIQQQQSLFQSCVASPASVYQGENTAGSPPGALYLSIPSPYTSQYTVTYTGVSYWDGTNGVYDAHCVSDGYQAQLIQITVTDIATGVSYTNSFVVDFPSASSGASQSGTAYGLFFEVQPGPTSYPYTAAGIPLGFQPVVDVEDVNSVPVTSDLSPVTLALSGGTPGATLTGCSGNEVLGVITFTGCTVSLAGTGYIITASDNSLPTGAHNPQPSNPFSVGASAPALVFEAGTPVAGASGSLMTTQPVVQVEINGVADPTWTGTISLSSSGNGKLSGCTNLTITAADHGVANVTGCSFQGGLVFNPVSSVTVATIYFLTATATGVASGMSGSVFVTSAGTASQLVFSTQPTGVASNNPATPFTGQPSVTVEDAFGNPVTSGYAPTISITGISVGTLSGCTSTNANGVTTFSGCAGSAYANGVTITATSSDHLLTVTSAPFNITRAASVLVFTTQPAAGVSGTDFLTEPVLAEEDSLGNVVTSASAQVTLTPSGNGKLSFCSGLTPVNGVVTVTSCNFAGTVGTTYTLLATAPGLTPATSAGFKVTSPGTASTLVFTTEPVAGASQSPFTVEPVITVLDSGGNVVTTANVTVTLTPLGGDLASCSGLTAVAGVVNVSNCTFAGVVGTNYTLTASANGLVSATSTTFSPTGPGPASQIVLTGCLSSFDVTTTCTATATTVDEFDNVESSFASGITFAQTSGSGSVTGLTVETATGGVASDILTGASAGTVIVGATGDSVSSNPLPITVNAAPTISTVTLPQATTTGSYSQSVTGVGGTTPYVWSITAGALPAGLTLNASTGTISGTVSASVGTYNISVTLTDADILTATQPLSIVVNTLPSITTSSPLATATQTQTGYSQTIVGAGGTGPYTWSLASGSMPGGLNLNAITGVISGTVTGTTQTFSIALTDANGVTATKAFTITVNPAPTIITASPLAVATQNEVGYSQTLVGTGGVTPYAWSVTSGILPTGLTLDTSTGAITGTVSASAVSESFTVTLTDANNVPVSKSFTITVNSLPSITTASPLKTATQTQTGYSQTLAGTNGTAPYTWAVTTGTLPTGLTLNTTTGIISGTVTGSTEIFTVTLTDANGVTATKQFTITVNAAPSITTTSPLTTATLSTAYSQTLTGTNGVTPYTWAVTSGTLPTGLSLNTTSGAITGTVGAAANTQIFTVTLTDANGVTVSKSFTITVTPKVSTTTLPNVTVGQTNYSQTLTGIGGTTPYTWSVTSGTLPTGLTLSGAGVISGGPIAGSTQTFTVTLTDAGGATATKSLTITVIAAPSITTATLPNAALSAAYSQTVVGTGGVTPYIWSITAGTLPTGLSINSSSGVISGTVSAAANTQIFTVTLTDANGVSVSKAFTITVTPKVSTTTLPNAALSTAYSQTLAGAGGTTPYNWTVTTGTLPTGLTLSTGGVISGTVGAAANTETFTVTLTDAAGLTATQSLKITVAPNITTTTLPNAALSTAYSQTLVGAGGTTPYTWTKTGTLPTGLTLSTGGVISGTVSATAHTETFTVTLTDAASQTDTQSLTITVTPNITTTTLPNATLSAAYSQTLAGAGGTTPYNWTVTTGTLPTGLTLSTGGVISGTVGAAANTETFTVTLTDAAGQTDTQSLKITVTPKVSTTTLPNAALSTAYSQTLAGAGGTTPYNWTVTTGTLPTGLTLSTGGVISGTVGAAANTETFTVTLTDAAGLTATQSLKISVTPNITTTTLPNGVNNQAYSPQTLAGAGGTTPYNWTVTTGTLPAGLALSTGGVISGTVNNTAVTETFTVKLTDAAGLIDTQILKITIT